MAVRAGALLLAMMLGSTTPCFAQDPAKQDPAAQNPTSQDPAAKPPAPFHPAEQPATPDTWIFSGVLASSKQPFSGTLVAGADGSEFEFKVGGATCDGGNLKGEVGMVRLPEITCSDDRTLRALFVPQGGQTLKVFGHVGDERFSAEAHLLGTEAVPDPKQTAEPKGPLGLPPPGAATPK